jgi:capsular polysaccharide transport system permease protein
MATIKKIVTQGEKLRASSMVFFKIFERNKRIIRAIMLQDMRTRFGRSYFSYIISILWPLSHLTIIIAGYALLNKFAPIGGDPVMFAATGVLPYIMCLYPARQIALAIIQNRQLLQMPIIRPFHILIARAILEIITVIIVCIIFVTTLYCSGYDILPLNIANAASAILSTVYLGVGYGFFGLIIVGLFGPYAILAIIFSMIGLYLASGVYLPPFMMSETILSYQYYNPIFNCSAWMRSAYYTSYDDIEINKSLIFWSGTVLLMLGLLGERYLRGKFF